VGAGSKDMGCAPVTEILVKEGQMEAVESLIGDGEGGTGGGVWGLAAGGQVAGAARGRGGRHESGGVSCCCCWLAGGSWELGLGVDGSWSLELLGAGCTRLGLNTQPAVTGTREQGSEGARGERMEKSFEFGRPEHKQRRIAAEEREGGARDKSTQVKKDKTSRGRDY
jgi:hypothetical protein